MVGVIYKYTSPSGKVYIGQTRNENNRKHQFKCLSCNYGGKAINNARIKYTPDKFEYEVLESIEAENIEQLQISLNELEAKYVAFYKSNNPKYGYNETVGGQNAANYGMLGKSHSEQTKSKIAEKLRNDSDTIARCRENGMKTAIKVDVFTRDGVFMGTFDSISDAAKAFNANKANVAKCVKGVKGYRTAKGYIFKER